MLLALTEIVVSVLVFAFFVTQVVVPIWKGTILMPFFRRTAKDLERNLAEAKEELTEAEIESEIERLRKLAQEKRKQ